MTAGLRLLHAITAAHARAALPDLEIVTGDGLQALCTPVHEDAGDADPEWLAAAARRHHGVVQQLFELGPVLPVRFGTAMERVAIGRLLLDHQVALLAELGRLEGLGEWGVKLLVDPADHQASAERSSELVRALDLELRQSAPGRAFLLRRKREAAVVEAVDQHSAKLLEKLCSLLGPKGLDMAPLPLPAASPAGPEMLANLSFLVRNSEVDDFTATADRIAQEAGVQLELSGPWPPYSFVRLNLGEPHQ